MSARYAHGRDIPAVCPGGEASTPIGYAETTQ